MTATKLYIPQSELSLYRLLHRSGWNWVLNQMYNNSDIIAKPTETYEPEFDTSLTFLDSYLDRTFHWDYNLLKAKNVLPYTKKWIGFLHHTFDTTYTVYNATAMFQNQDFIDSLYHCKGLFVLSDALHEDLEQNLYNLSTQDFKYANFANIPVMTLVHPTALDVPPFSLDNFLSNPCKKIVQIGSWMRDSYAIYKLPDLTIFNLQKAILIPVNSDPVTKPAGLDAFFESFTADYEAFSDANVIANIPFTDALNPDLSNATANEIYYTPQQTICRDISSSAFGGNKYIKGLYDLYQKMDSEVEIIPTLSDHDFDCLLSKNIVYLQLYDASGINTLMECIARGTPVLVNPIPAVTELLGSNYPFYYDENDPSVINQSKFNLFSLRTIQSTLNYLSQMDISQLDINNFISNFVNSDIIADL